MFAPSTAVRRGFALALAAVLVTSGCAAGRDAQTQNQIPTQDGTNANAGTMALRGLSLEAPSSGTYYPSGSTIPMRLVLVNNGLSNDQLTGITTSVAGGWANYRSETQAALSTVAPTSSTSSTSSAATSGAPTSSAPTSGAPASGTAVTVPAGQRVSWGVPDSKRVLVLLSSVGRVYPGNSVKITFTFSKAGSVTTVVPVQTSSDQGDSTIEPGPTSNG